MNAYTGFAYVYDEYMDNIPYEEWTGYLIELLKENGIKEGQQIADLGCGTGTVTQILDNAGYELITHRICLQLHQKRCMRAGSRLYTAFRI